MIPKYPKYIDTHSHVNFEAFNEDYKQVIQNTLDQNVWLTNVGSQYPTSERAVQMANEFEKGVFAAVGHHPTHVDDQEWSIEKIQKLIDENPEKVVAIGETGLDYFRVPKTGKAEYIERQKQLFRDHIELAIKNKLPLIIHSRDAYDDIFDILAEYKERFTKKPHGVVHCYVSDLETAQKFLDLGFWISFTGIITFTDDQELLEVVKKVPMDKVMIETDAPYLSPVPKRGKRNEPLYTKHVGEKLAEIKGLSVEEVLEKTTKNAILMFGFTG